MDNQVSKMNFGELMESDAIGIYYSKVYNNITNKLIYSSPKTDDAFFKNRLVYIHDVPDYLKTESFAVSTNIKQKKINSYQGSVINLKNYNSIDDYLVNEITSKERYEIRRRQKRLDTCIKPVYKTFYGNITKAEYDIIFNDYKQMLLRRLEQKQSYWEELDYWEERYKTSYKLIHEKKACVFAIYHNESPIAIYINSVFDKIIFNEVVAYDIDYSRFNIGILIFIKLIEWSINNGMELMDMSKGDFSYKVRFRNGTYTFQNQLIYDSRKVSICLKANLVTLKQRTIYNLLPWLKKLKLNKLNTAFKRIKKRHVFKEYAPESYVIEKETVTDLDSIKNLKIMDIDKDTVSFLKKPIIDFAFLNVECFDDILVYNDSKNKNRFYIKGKKSMQQLVKQ